MTRGWLIGGTFAGALLLAANSVFVVDQSHQAVVVSGGRPARLINVAGGARPGLALKLPVVEQAAIFDRRDIALAALPQTLSSADGQPLTVEAYARYGIVDPIRFWRAAGDEAGAGERLAPLVSAALRSSLAGARAADIIAMRQGLSAALLADLRARAARLGMGIAVTDAGLRRVAVPAGQVDQVWARMRTDFAARAAQLRAAGETSRRQTMAEADQAAAQTLAHAGEQASAVRGAGDAQADQLYAASYGRDPAFAEFYRSMRAYDAALARGDVTIVVTPDNDFLKYFRSGPRLPKGG